jgi:hypothetical protein
LGLPVCGVQDEAVVAFMIRRLVRLNLDILASLVDLWFTPAEIHARSYLAMQSGDAAETRAGGVFESVWPSGQPSYVPDHACWSLPETEGDTAVEDAEQRQHARVILLRHFNFRTLGVPVRDELIDEAVGALYGRL